MTDIFNQDSELALLSILFSKPEKIAEMLDLKAFMFTSTTNQVIYNSIEEIRDAGNIPEYTMVKASLESKNKIKEAGGNDYLEYIKNSVFVEDNLKEYLRQIIESYKSRSLISLSTTIPSRLYSGEGSDLVMSSIKQHLDNLLATSGGDNVVDIYNGTTEVWDEIKYRIDHPGIKGIPTGIQDLDYITGGFIKGDLWIIAGRPGMGKSQQMVNSALAASKIGKSVLIFSLEMNKSQIIERLISIESGVPLQDIRIGTLTQKQLDAISKTIGELRNLKIYIDDNPGTDINYFISTTRKYKKLKDIDQVYLDYIQLACERGADQTAELGRFSRGSKLLARELEIPVIVYSQLNRGVEARDDKRPVLSDLRQSGNIEEDADIALFLYKDFYYNPSTAKADEMEMIIRKHRNGSIGTVFCKVDPPTLRMSNE